MKSIKFLWPLIIFAVLVGFLYAGLSLNPREMKSTRLDKPAPFFKLLDVQKPESFFSSEQLRGKVSILNVWASWCVSCRQEHPLLMQLSKQKRINLYGLNWKDTLPAAQKWLAQHGNPYLASAFDTDGRVGIDYGVTGTPETFILDKKGIVRYKHVGPIGVKDFTDIFWPMIQELEAEQV
ncbi:DsbE family thiol:disulfide interchange protein [Candidatus Venteria ishoeyi]|uniref:DsbE family thiol:disulfide interchange protein n=1 Tax=Candidatus Venteria ishoeyi TaxID=1899563 RepID=UPI0025A5DA8E|nr:DsbE family thiol:disulfide interchange protein [Candidatus Venteria ishoeyi]MDM8547823.1 DsbE family thiol:disulfide interchange protein [Candidatus Venteria ishoeyi]